MTSSSSTESTEKEGGEEQQESTSTSEKKETLQRKQLRAEGVTWTVVSTADELKTVLAEADPPSHIKLGGDAIFTLSTDVPVKSNVVIDGDGRTISSTSGGTSGGIHAAASNIEVTLQNMTFGSSDYTVPMNNLYGIFPATDSRIVTLNVHNVKYYSNRNAQAFYLRGTGSNIHFSGENEFVLEGSGQEFAEASIFYFEKGSVTKVRHQTESNDGFIYATNSSNRNLISLKEDAVFDVETNHAFMYNSSSRNGDIDVGKNAKLLIKSVNAKSGTSSSPFHNDGQWNMTVNEGGLLDVNYPRSIRLGNNSSIYIGKDANAYFKTTENNSVFTGSVGRDSSFVIDNANSVSFTAAANANTNPIGFAGGTNMFTFAPFSQGEDGGQSTEGYSIRTTPSFSINSQKAAGSWNITSGNITRQAVTETENFTTDEQNAMKAATTIQLVKIPEPRSQIAALKKVPSYQNLSVQLANYDLYNNSFVRLTYRLFSKEVDDPTSTEGFIEEKTVDTLAEIEEAVSFEGLEQDTHYWIYAQIVSSPSGQSSLWFKDKAKTKAMINVEVPTYIAFRTDTDDKVVQDREYEIKNNGTSPVKIKVDSFKVKSNPDNLSLLTKNQLGNSDKGLFIELFGNQTQGIGLANLEAPVDKPDFATIASASTEKIGIQGEYQGSIEKVTHLTSQLTLLIEDGSVENGGDNE